MLDLHTGVKPGSETSRTSFKIPRGTEIFMMITKAGDEHPLACSFEKSPHADVQEGQPYFLRLFANQSIAATVPKNSQLISQGEAAAWVATFMEVNSGSTWTLDLGANAAQHALPQEAAQHIGAFTEIAHAQMIIQRPEKAWREAHGELGVNAACQLSGYRTTPEIKLFPGPPPHP